MREQAVYCSSSVIVSAQSDMIISGHTRKSTHTEMVLIETSALSTECSSDGLVFGRTLVDMTRGKFPVQVVNPGSFDIQIYANCKLTTIIPVLQIAEVNLPTNEKSSLHPVVQEMYEKNISELDSKQQILFHDLLVKWQDLFAKDTFDIGYCDIMPHTIDTGCSTHYAKSL